MRHPCSRTSLTAMRNVTKLERRALVRHACLCLVVPMMLSAMRLLLLLWLLLLLLLLWWWHAAVLVLTLGSSTTVAARTVEAVVGVRVAAANAPVVVAVVAVRARVGRLVHVRVWPLVLRMRVHASCHAWMVLAVLRVMLASVVRVVTGIWRHNTKRAAVVAR